MIDRLEVLAVSILGRWFISVLNILERALAVLLILLLSPILIVSLIIVFLEDGFPLFFVQKRLGRYFKLFNLYKLRTMVVGTPVIASNELKNPISYLLRSGKLFRKLSIDELPNLFNIVLGDMSFIGYRPLLESEIEINQLRLRNGIYNHKPGLTGLAQVNGRDEITINRKIVFERYYAKNKSLKLKAIIIYRSILIVLRTSGIRF